MFVCSHVPQTGPELMSPVFSQSTGSPACSSACLLSHHTLSERKHQPMLHTIMGPYGFTSFLLIAKYQVNPLVEVLRHISAFQGILVLLEKVLGTYQGRLHQNFMPSLLYFLSFLVPIHLCLKLLGEKRYMRLFFPLKTHIFLMSFYSLSYIFFFF